MPEVPARGGVRMRALKSYSGPEGIVATNQTVYTGYRENLETGEYERVSHVNPEIRARYLENKGLAVRDVPGTAPQPDRPGEDKRARPAEAPAAAPPSEDKRVRPTEAKGVDDLPTTLGFRCDHPGCGKELSSMSGLRAHQRTHRDEEAQVEPEQG